MVDYKKMCENKKDETIINIFSNILLPLYEEYVECIDDNNLIHLLETRLDDLIEGFKSFTLRDQKTDQEFKKILEEIRMIKFPKNEKSRKKLEKQAKKLVKISEIAKKKQQIIFDDALAELLKKLKY